MDEEIQIINTNSRNEKIKNFFINNKKKIISLILIILFIILSYFFYSEFEKKKSIKIANKYDNATIAFNLGNKSLAIKDLKEIINKKNKTYSPLALYFLLDNDLINSKEEINDFFNLLIKEVKLEKEMKNLTIYKKALFNSDFETENNLLIILNPLINSESIWKQHGLYLLAEYFYSKGEKQKSKEFFNKILELKDINPKIKTDTQKKIRTYFSE